MSQRSITAEIAAFATSRPVLPPASALAVARLSLMDWAAVSVAGRDEPVAAMVRELALDEAGAGQSTAIGLSSKVPTRMAALVNGTLSHALDYDDTHFSYVGHPSVAVMPAALAMAERQGADVRAFLEAALMGMEAACRIGHWLGTRHYNHGFHQTATSGAFGAAVAAGRLLGLAPEAMRHALGIVATRASGLKSQFGTMGKPFNAGIAAANGVEAVLLAARGFVSRPDGIECAQGFGETHAGECIDIDGALADLGQRYWFEAVQHKFHACCHGLHAVLEALRELRALPGVAPESISRIELRVSPRWLRVCHILSPATGLEAKFSYRLTSAMVLSGLDTGSLDVYTAATCETPALIALRNRVDVTGDSAVADTAAHVRLTLHNGQTHDAFADLDAPMPIDARRRRIVGKLKALLPRQQAEAIIAFDTGSADMPARTVAEVIGEMCRG